MEALLPEGAQKLRHELVGWPSVHASIVEALNWWHAFDDRVKAEWPAAWGEGHAWAEPAMRWLERDDAVERVARAMIAVQADSRGRRADLGNARQVESATKIGRDAVWDLRAYGAERIVGTVRGARWIRNAAHHDWAHLITLRGGGSTVARDKVLTTLTWVADVQSSRPSDGRASAYQAHFAGELVQRAFWDLTHIGFVAVAMLHGEVDEPSRTGAPSSVASRTTSPTSERDHSL